MKNKYLLFDFDGVISNTFEIAYDIMTDLNENLKDPDEFRGYFEGNPYDSAKRGKDVAKATPTAQDPFFSKYGPRLHKETIDPKIKSLIEEVAQDFHLTIMSSTITQFIEQFLEKEGVRTCFGKIYGPEISIYKSDRIEEIFQREQVTAKDCLFITDTLGDIREARQANVDAVGVTWGYHYPDTLQQGNPVAIVNTPEELKKEINKYFA